MDSVVRNAIVAAAAAVAALGTVASFSLPSSASTPAYPARLAAPYLQISTSTSGDMAADMKATGLKYYTLAFLTAKSGCTLNWEAGNESVTAFGSVVSTLQKAGGNVIISFGGADSTELAETCTSEKKLEAAYAQVLSDYPGVTRLDFDIEGNVLANTKATSLRNKTLAALQKAHPSLSIDLTLAVNPSGLPPAELNLVQQAKSDGVKINEVNIMTQYFGSGQNDLTDAESAANGTESQLAGIYPSLSSAQLWHMIGLTPFAGAESSTEDFSISDASSLETWAASHGVQELAFWEVAGEDAPTGYQYSKIFKKITS